jgi:membrane protein implicated in regulation of membrane protease activity
MSGLQLVVLAVFMMVLGIVLPFMMMVGTIRTTFLLSFVSFALSVGGFLVGVIGATQYVARRRRQHDESDRHDR